MLGDYEGLEDKNERSLKNTHDDSALGASSQMITTDSYREIR